MEGFYAGFEAAGEQFGGFVEAGNVLPGVDLTEFYTIPNAIAGANDGFLVIIPSATE